MAAIADDPFAELARQSERLARVAARLQEVEAGLEIARRRQAELLARRRHLAAAAAVAARERGLLLAHQAKKRSLVARILHLSGLAHLGREVTFFFWRLRALLRA